MNSIDVLTGIIPARPAYEDHDFPELFTFKAPIDHYAVIKGIPLGSKGSLTRDYKPIHIPAVGSLYKKETIPGISYASIGLTTSIQDGIIAEITPELNVTLNGVTIAYSPKYTLSKTGKDKTRTQAEKLRFCKAVIWALVNDETSLKDKLSEIGYVPPVCNVVKDFMIEEITLSPFPGPGIVEEIEYTEAYAYQQNNPELAKTLDNELSDMVRDELYNNLSLDAENNGETPEEIFRAFCTIPAGTYYPHIRCYIQEVSA